MMLISIQIASNISKIFHIGLYHFYHLKVYFIPSALPHNEKSSKQMIFLRFVVIKHSEDLDIQLRPDAKLH